MVRQRSYEKMERQCWKASGTDTWVDDLDAFIPGA